MTAAFFLAKFRAIPDELWCVKQYHGAGWQRCAIGHTQGYKMAGQERALIALFDTLGKGRHGQACKDINDGLDPRFPQPTPKQRIIAALEMIESNSLTFDI